MDSWEIHPSSSRLLYFLARLLVGIYFCCSLALFLPFFIAPVFSSQHRFIQKNDNCTPPSFVDTCGNASLSIQFPFWRKDWPGNCAYDKEFEISCNSTENSYEIEIQSSKFHIKSIESDDYFRSHAIIAEKQVLKETNDRCMIPARTGANLNIGPFDYSSDQNMNITLFYNCSSPNPSDDKNEPGAPFKSLQCLSNEEAGRRAYFVVSSNPTKKEPGKGCERMEIPIQEQKLDLLVEKPEDAWNFVLAEGFVVSWAKIYQNCKEECHQSNGMCIPNRTSLQHPFCWCRDEPNRLYMDACPLPLPGSNNKGKKIITGIIAGGVLLVLACSIILIFYKKRKFQKRISFNFWKNKRCDKYNIEEFLEKYGSSNPMRFKYSELRKITSSFKDNLGQGGCGCVFKGKLKDNRLVAVKILNTPNGSDDKEFINEVASISRTHHVNVVALLGFCFEGSKRALVYEFMSNGSLEKFIFNNDLQKRHSLDCQKLFEISLGIARGLEYLHRGCNIRIVHFDIKPHNILLDDELCPKISDFGLAKLCPRQDTNVSMTNARGTIGYIAPEVLCRNIGVVSHKSDVYSYGMMVLEMVGGRKNIDAHVENTSEIYFPHWAYKHIELENGLAPLGYDTELDNEMTKKMLLVSLWCIQTDPKSRPSMSEVVEMLEGSLDNLQMPPKPYLSSP